MAFFLKDPAATLDYSVDWGAGYLDGATIATSRWAVAPVEPDGIIILGSVGGATRTGATLGGGVAGHIYRVVNTILLSTGRTDERGIALRVEDR